MDLSDNQQHWVCVSGQTSVLCQTIDPDALAEVRIASSCFDITQGFLVTSQSIFRSAFGLNFLRRHGLERFPSYLKLVLVLALCRGGASRCQDETFGGQIHSPALGSTDRAPRHPTGTEASSEIVILLTVYNYLTRNSASSHQGNPFLFF